MGLNQYDILSNDSNQAGTTAVSCIAATTAIASTGQWAQRLQGRQLRAGNQSACALFTIFPSHHPLSLLVR